MQLSAAGDGPAVRMDRDGGTGAGGWPGQGTGHDAARADTPVACISGKSRHTPMQLSAISYRIGGWMLRDSDRRRVDGPAWRRVIAARAGQHQHAFRDIPTLPHATVCHRLRPGGRLVLDGGIGRGRMAGAGPGNRGEGKTLVACITGNSDATPCNCLPSVTAWWSAWTTTTGPIGEGWPGGGQDGDGENGGSALFAKSRSYPMQLSPTGRPCRRGRVRAG